jgi:hypothetical protein
VRLVKYIGDINAFIQSQLCAGRVGQLLNYTRLANDDGISPNKAKAWLSILESSYILYRLQPFHRNFNKRLVKSSKLYFYDTGIACSLLGIHDENQVNLHYMKGALFENLIIAVNISCRIFGRIAEGKRLTTCCWTVKKSYQLRLNLVKQFPKVTLIISNIGTKGKCSNCGHLQNLELRDRVFHCENCTLMIGRDHNAAKNIFTIGTSMEYQSIGKTKVRLRSRVDGRSPQLSSALLRNATPA